MLGKTLRVLRLELSLASQPNVWVHEFIFEEGVGGGGFGYSSALQLQLHSTFYQPNPSYAASFKEHRVYRSKFPVQLSQTPPHVLLKSHAATTTTCCFAMPVHDAT